ncbi:cAMP-binding domain of CRP or a regulatory subunit of cAMP-dependent protein kinases [Filimonas lacunae]|uniref:cAMP-binding domain of CRP or a regulatory subunit of cAMP-dependent protein kinases n=1 Tax=Filimonas lacunae TaxID=477680 RepID=A0A173MA10_9BACT|nr:Crp/Fnr family transcriptional regulator [Filimonas lacunae]BAV04375.1 transcriptional regulator, Crp/Fnr family [Filimonas lacunae]SIT31196.1 cAMP-binding domain of CRP or a regulatory subunit of cAMP-dependent protein kinases [Filimonas lacunae]
MPTIMEKGLYAYLTDRKEAGLKENVITKKLKKGDILYDTTQQDTGIFEIVSGAVKLGGISNKGKEYIYELLTPGEFFGNLAFLGPDFCEFCKVLTATELRYYKTPYFKHLITHDPQLADWAFSKIVFRWNKTESMLANIRSYEPRERIQVLYSSLQRKIMTANGREVFLNKLITYQDIADLTATTRQLAADTIH